jgi:hypothetical protein
VEVLRLRGFTYLGNPRGTECTLVSWFALHISCADSPSRHPGDPPSFGVAATMAAFLFHTLLTTMRREHHYILIDKEVTTQERWTKNGFLHFFLLLNLHVDN